MHVFVICFFKQKTAYEMRISDWSSDVCFSDLHPDRDGAGAERRRGVTDAVAVDVRERHGRPLRNIGPGEFQAETARRPGDQGGLACKPHVTNLFSPPCSGGSDCRVDRQRSEEHPSELQSLMRISYAVFCLKKKKYKQT